MCPKFSVSLVDLVTLETEEPTLEREQNESDVLETLGEYKCKSHFSTDIPVSHCDTGMSVEKYDCGFYSVK
jgi:hypothetical protein